MSLAKTYMFYSLSYFYLMHEVRRRMSFGKSYMFYSIKTMFIQPMKNQRVWHSWRSTNFIQPMRFEDGWPPLSPIYSILFLYIPCVLKKVVPLDNLYTLFVQSHFNAVNDIRILIALVKIFVIFTRRHFFPVHDVRRKMSLSVLHVLLAPIHCHTSHVLRNTVVFAETYGLYSLFIRFEATIVQSMWFRGWPPLNTTCSNWSRPFLSSPCGSKKRSAR